MKKISKLLAITALFFIMLTGCAEDKTTHKRDIPKSEDFLIIWDGSGIEKQTAYLIESELCRQGYTANTQNAKEKPDDNHKCIISIGEKVDLSSNHGDIPVVRCIPRGGIASRDADIYPFVGTKDIVRAAVLLLPSAQEFALISELNGAADVQDACDHLDLCGINYTVEVTDGRPLGIESELCRQGYTANTQNAKEKPDDNHKCIISIGEKVDLSSNHGDIPVVRCIPRGGIASRDADIYPFVGTKDIVRAAVLLLPSAQEFALISELNGAADVQDACDHLDLCGINYTVEVTDGRPLGDTVISAKEKGCDAVILPMHALDGINIEPLSISSAIIAVGEGEAVRGALASFCIDVELLAEHTAALAVSKVKKEAWSPDAESYYVICVSEKLSKDHTVDLSALREDFKVVSVE